MVVILLLIGLTEGISMITNWEKIFPFQVTNPYIPLLEISTPIIEYFNNGNIVAFAKNFTNTVRSMHNEEIDEITDNFLISIQCLECETGQTEEERFQEAKAGLHEYLQNLIDLINFDDIRKTLLQDAPSEFSADYFEIEKNLSQKDITLDVAEQSFLAWKDAMPDVLLQKALLHLRYSYIASKLNYSS
jgi:hypothetical protein